MARTLQVSPPLVRFGPYEINLDSGDLRKFGYRVRLQPKSFLVLRALLVRPGELVTREELKAQLWPENTFVEFESSLNVAVRRLREVLGRRGPAPGLHRNRTAPWLSFRRDLELGFVERGRTRRRPSRPMRIGNESRVPSLRDPPGRGASHSTLRRAERAVVEVPEDVIPSALALIVWPDRRVPEAERCAPLVRPSSLRSRCCRLSIRVRAKARSIFPTGWRRSY